jgi:hypothetical protein
MAGVVQTSFRWGQAGKISMKRLKKIAIAIAIIAVPIFLYFAPVYSHNPQFCGGFCSAGYSSPIYQLTSQNGGIPPYGVFGAVYSLHSGLQSGRSEYSVYFGTHYFNFLL